MLSELICLLLIKEKGANILTLRNTGPNRTDPGKPGRLVTLPLRSASYVRNVLFHTCRARRSRAPRERVGVCVSLRVPVSDLFSCEM